ncbi:MAG: FliA/WhiG family RNA polymerase sigma factor [Defluviitaleaceae bacterium]|nr:FliA/WhiG family RNA polymerase sigma factor [Defluviitaleaceae bacterium]
MKKDTKDNKDNGNIDELWKAYDLNKTKPIRDKLIIHYSSLVNFIAGRMYTHLVGKVEYDDLVSYGIFGLIDAIDRFDYKKGVKFETYAPLRIRGAIVDSIRKMDWVPKDLRRKSKIVEAAFEALSEKLQREPADEELAAELNLSLAELRALISKTTLVNLVSLDEYSDQSHELNLYSTSETPELSYDKVELANILTNAIDNLKEAERKVITLYYFEELTLREISEVLEVSTSRISQIHSKAMLKLRAKLGQYQHLLDIF